MATSMGKMMINKLGWPFFTWDPIHMCQVKHIEHVPSYILILMTVFDMSGRGWNCLETTGQQSCNPSRMFTKNQFNQHFSSRAVMMYAVRKEMKMFWFMMNIAGVMNLPLLGMIIILNLGSGSEPTRIRMIADSSDPSGDVSRWQRRGVGWPLIILDSRCFREWPSQSGISITTSIWETTVPIS